MRLLGATASHVGNVREANQDRAYFRGVVAALADGMGGHQGGERAAELAIGEFRQIHKDLSEGDLVDMVIAANRQVHGHAADNGLPGMGTTLVALTLHSDATITVANVGDSRAYWLRGDYMSQVTEDHSFVEDLVRQGRLTPDEAAIHPQRNILTRAVGIGADVEVDRFPIQEPKVGDRFLLCSDGLFNELTEEEIQEILLGGGDPIDTAKALIDATLQTPCRDNVTVAVVDVVADDDPRLAAQDEREGAEPDGETTAEYTDDDAITAPMPVVSKSVLHDPGSTTGAEPAAGDKPVAHGVPQNGAQRAGTLLLAEAAAGNGTAEKLEATDSQRHLATAEVVIVNDEPMRVQPRSRLILWLGVVLFLAGLVGGGYFLARGYARSGYFIAPDESTGELVIFQGRRGGFLGFEPVGVAETGQSLEDLNRVERSMVAETEFSDRQEAEAVIDQIELRQSAEDDVEADGASSGSSESSQGSTSSQSTQLAESTSTGTGSRSTSDEG